MAAIEDVPRAQSEATGAAASLGSLDLNCLDRHIAGVDELNTLAAYTEAWNGVKWLRVNYDSGAVTTALPLEVVEASGFKAVKQGESI